MTAAIPILGQRADSQERKIEVCRSFSRKLNLANYGGAQYESADFFASAKIECNYEDRLAVGEELQEECAQEVQRAMAAYVTEMQRKKQQRAARPQEMSA